MPSFRPPRACASSVWTGCRRPPRSSAFGLRGAPLAIAVGAAAVVPLPCGARHVSCGAAREDRPAVKQLQGMKQKEPGPSSEIAVLALGTAPVEPPSQHLATAPCSLHQAEVPLGSSGPFSSRLPSLPLASVTIENPLSSCAPHIAAKLIFSAPCSLYMIFTLFV